MPEKFELIVRPATPADLDVIWSFIQKKAAFDNWLDRLESTPETLAAALFADHPLMGALLAESNGAVVGFATYFFTFSTYLARRCLWLDDLYVDAPARGQGTGTALLRALARLAATNNCPRIEWVTAAGNAKAIAFYESLGADVRHTIRLCRLDGEAIASLAKSNATPDAEVSPA